MKPPTDRRKLEHELGHMKPGFRYKIRHKIVGVQRYDRESVLTYEGRGGPDGDEFIFSGRVKFDTDERVCGTTSLRVHNIFGVEEVPKNATMYVNRRAPT